MTRRVRRCAGFTLIEAIIAMVLTGILAGIVAVFIAKPVEGYVDSARRAELTDAADVALRRLARDVRLALPNSLRQTSATAFEFISTKGGARYRDPADGSSGAGLKYLFIDAASFDVVGPIPSLATGDLVVVNNLGAGYAPADAYAMGNVATVGAGTLTANPIPLSSNPFPTQSPPLPSPSARFQVVDGTDRVIRYTCTGGLLTRISGCTLATPSDCSSPATSALLAGSAAGTPSASCTIDYTAAASGRNGLLYVQLTLTDVPSGESVTLFQQIHVDNSP
jgi:MSHA biogenesis protein MshO